MEGYARAWAGSPEGGVVTRRRGGAGRWWRGLAWVAVALSISTSARAGGDWNDEGIAWKDLPEALAAAEKEGTPVCLVVYTDWCPHCTNYSKVFHDAAIEERAKHFSMVRIDQDKRKRVAERYAPDGAYVPRTLFLGADGQIDESLHAPRAKYVHFYDEHDPVSLRQAMDAALEKLVASDGS